MSSQSMSILSILIFTLMICAISWSIIRLLGSEIDDQEVFILMGTVIFLFFVAVIVSLNF